MAAAFRRALKLVVEPLQRNPKPVTDSRALAYSTKPELTVLWPPQNAMISHRAWLEIWQDRRDSKPSWSHWWPGLADNTQQLPSKQLDTTKRKGQLFNKTEKIWSSQCLAGIVVAYGNVLENKLHYCPPNSFPAKFSLNRQLRTDPSLEMKCPVCLGLPSL